MKNIVKTIVCLAAFFLIAACERELNPVTEKQETPAAELTITATRAPLTKVDLAEDSGTNNLVGSWKTGDVIFGFTNAGATVSFSVASVDGSTGVATLSQTTSVALADGDVVHVIHCPGKTASDLSGQTLEVDFSSQTASVIPVLMLSTATVSGNALAFSFNNAVSILGLKSPVFPAATTADKLLNITVSGHEIVSSGVVSLSGGNLVFTGNAPDKFITKTLNAPPIKSGETFTIADPVYIVLPAGKVAKVSAIDNRNNFFEYEVNKTAVTSKYYCINGKTFTKVALPTTSEVVVGGIEWAKCNLGGSGVTAMGDIYKWSDIKLIYTARTSSTPYVTYDSDHAAGFTTYVGECYFDGSVYTKYNTADQKTVLDPVDDIVQLTYPGSGWRMPKLSEFQALFTNTEGNETTYGGSGNNFGTTVTKGEKSVFFRGNTQVCAPSSKDKLTLGKKGRFWTSTITPANLKTTGGNPDFVQMNTDGTQAAAPTYSNAVRHSGFSIRPVRPE